MNTQRGLDEMALSWRRRRRPERPKNSKKRPKDSTSHEQTGTHRSTQDRFLRPALTHMLYYTVLFYIIFLISVSSVNAAGEKQEKTPRSTLNELSAEDSAFFAGLFSYTNESDEVFANRYLNNSKEAMDTDFFNATQLPVEIPPNLKVLKLSYMAALPRMSKAIFDRLAVVSAKDSTEVVSADILHEANCFQKDFQGGMISGAINVAINKINSDPDLLPGFYVTHMFENTCGSESTSTRLFMEHWRQGAKVFIGPEMNCRVEAAMAAAQNLPILSYKCKDQNLSNKRKFPTFARTVPAETEITKSFMALMKHYRWHRFAVVHDGQSNKEELYQSIKAATEEENERMNLINSKEDRYHISNVSVVPYPFDDIQQEIKARIQAIVRNTKDETRIYVVFGDPMMFRSFVTEMGDSGLMNDGKYVAVFLDPDYNWLNPYHANSNHFFRDTRQNLLEGFVENSQARKMANYTKTVLAIIPTPVKLKTAEYKKFWIENNYYLKAFGTYTTKNQTIMPNRVACYLYDAVMLYATAATEYMKSGNISANEAISNGREIIKRILGRTYRSMQGFDMRINMNGDAEGNFTLLSLQPLEPYHDKTSLDYYPINAGLDVTAAFMADGKANDLPKLRFHRMIPWPTGNPPRDEPECGFDGAKCRNEREYRIRLAIYITSALLLFVLLVSGAWAYHRKTFEDKISNIWRIEEREIHKIVHTNTSANSLYLYDAGSRQSLLNPLKDNNVTDKRFNSLRFVALYKNVAVAVKELNYTRKMKEPSRETRIEMKAMVQLRHDNVNSFKGIILQPSQNKILVVREFCQKNSLLDMLKNKDIKLDHIFVTSFVEDLIKGMIYIHESEVRVHGNLKSSNCLITNRWALQIADFGLNELRQGVAPVSEEAKWESRLWIAPELLKTIDSNQGMKPTPKSDVYSFGVILHEIITRRGPYEVYTTTNGTAEEIKKIVERITNPKDTPDGLIVHRPDLKNTECQDYIKSTISMCWEEMPIVRPDFRHAIRQKLKPMSADMHKRNIVDHMMLMMEKYQTELENLVDERTAQLSREKCRTENLLQRMLPPSVAAQLMYGGEVKPQSFEMVTIYFSDIVGFTNISGSSTPMQVVSLLNNLYTLFDSVIKQYDVYKVETIGDAYMVVSGVPIFNDAMTHGYEVCMMSLHLLDASQAFKIPHMPEEKLRVRIGIHSGPCVAGVVGKTMPRYCLFGDAVNVASRMESNGLPHRIHVSQNTANIINGISDFHLEERGLVEVKGKGQMRTYWLSIASDRVFPQTDIDKLQMEQDKLEYFPSSIFADRAHDLRIRKAPAKPMTRGFTMDAEETSRLSLLNGSQQILSAEGGILKRMFAKVTQQPDKYGPLPAQSQSFIPPSTSMAAEVKRALRTNRPASPTRTRLYKVFESNEENLGLLNGSFEFDQLKSGSTGRKIAKRRPDTIDEDLIEQRKKTSQSTNDSLAATGSKSGSGELREAKDKPQRKRSSSAPEMDKMEPLWRQYESRQLSQQQNKVSPVIPLGSCDHSFFDLAHTPRDFNNPSAAQMYRSDELTPINENLTDVSSHWSNEWSKRKPSTSTSSSSLQEVAKRKNALGAFPGISGDFKALEKIHNSCFEYPGELSDDEKDGFVFTRSRGGSTLSKGKLMAKKSVSNDVEMRQIVKKPEVLKKMSVVDSVMPKNLPNKHSFSGGVFGEPTPDPPRILDYDDEEELELPVKKISDVRHPKYSYPDQPNYDYFSNGSRYYDNEIDSLHDSGTVHPLLNDSKMNVGLEDMDEIEARIQRVNERRWHGHIPKDKSMEKLTRLLKKLDDETNEEKDKDKIIPKRPPRPKDQQVCPFPPPPRPNKMGKMGKNYSTQLNAMNNNQNMERSPLTSSTDTNSSEDQNQNGDHFIVDLSDL